MKNYKFPEVLVETQWVADHLKDSDIRIIESNEDVLLYDSGHIPGSVKIDWQSDLQHPIIRDYIHSDSFEDLAGKMGISNDTTVVFYGDKNNWWACYAFWTFCLFNHPKCLIMNGGRQKWVAENRELVRAVTKYHTTTYRVEAVNELSIRAFRDDVSTHVKAKRPLIDVRSPQEFSGELLHMESYPQEGALRGGHIPGSRNVPWAKAVNEDGTFKPYPELVKIYETELGLKPEDDIIAYCRIGERSSHTWFVLTYLLGFSRVRNYDGSWTEWGNLVKAPIER